MNIVNEDPVTLNIVFVLVSTIFVQVAYYMEMHKYCTCHVHVGVNIINDDVASDGVATISGEYYETIIKLNT